MRAALTVFCDPTLQPALAGLQGGPEIAILSAPAALMLAQITRNTRNDVLFTLSTAMDQAVQQGFVVPSTRQNGFFNPLVLAGVAAVPIPLATIAVTDNTPAAALDGRAVLAANKIAPAGILGAANTGDVAFLVTSGAANLGLMYLTDVRADARLKVAATLNADPGLTSYAAALNRKSQSAAAPGFLAFLNQPSTRAALAQAGLGVAA
jgi:ABC-type molybdate transport system substrate-binding protein